MNKFGVAPQEPESTDARNSAQGAEFMAKTRRVADIIKSAREAKGMGKTELASKVGVKRQTVYDWENGRSAPNRFRAPKVAKVLGLTLAELIADLSQSNVATMGTVAHSDRRVPLIDWVNAGRGAEVVAAQPLRNATEYIEIQAAASETTFALRVQGSSMEPEFHEGDVIVVDPVRRPANNDYVVAELLPSGTPEGHGDVTFKQYRYRGIVGGVTSFDLLPVNPEYPTATVNKGSPGRIVGTVIEHHRVLAR